MRSPLCSNHNLQLCEHVYVIVTGSHIGDYKYIGHWFLLRSTQLVEQFLRQLYITLLWS